MRRELDFSSILKEGQMQKFRNLVFKNRYTLLLSVLTLCVVAVVIEGAIVGREPKIIEFENPYFDFNARNIDQFMNNRRAKRE